VRSVPVGQSRKRFIAVAVAIYCVAIGAFATTAAADPTMQFCGGAAGCFCGWAGCTEECPSTGEASCEGFCEGADCSCTDCYTCNPSGSWECTNPEEPALTVCSCQNPL